MISSNGVYYTDNNGRITLDGLKPDTYVITETATISGYVIDRTPHTIAVKANDTQTLTITNRPRGGLIIMKLSRQTRQPLAGAEFRIVPADAALFTDNEGLTSPNNLYVTDADGQISLSNLTPGAYIITETNAPDGYSLDSEAQTVTVRSGRTESVSFYDSELAILKILKRDAVSGQPLADAEFTVTTADGTRLGDNNGIFTTDSDGTVTVTDLQPNSAVIVSESSSPAGYVMDATPKSVIVRSGTVNSLVFDDEPKTTLIVHKYISGTRNEPLAGVEFKVTDSKGEVRGMNNGVYYTDASGDFMVTGLDPGLTVTVRETKTVDGYVLDGTPQNILIKAGERQELTFWNQRKGTLIVRKLDSVTGNPISGAEFHIAYANGNPVDANNGRISSNGRYVTDSRGEITLTDVTGTIVVTETKAADGYYISPENLSQTIIVNPEDAQTVTFFNTPTQTLILQKYVTDTTTPIQGVAFHITDSAGNAVGSSNGDFVTDRNGQITISGLIPGTTITARESSVPDDYVLDATPRSILIRSGEAQTLTVYNQLRANLIVQKIDSATGSPLAGAQFKIISANGAEVTGFSGSTANNGVFTTDRAGQITLNKLIPGAYVLTEVKAPDNYVLNPQPQTILLGAGETKTVTVENAVKGSLIIRKFDSVTRQPLADAEFKIMTAEGTLVAANGGRTSSNGLYTTDANGQITLSGLEPGSYVVTETKAPDNYYLNVNSQTVAVTADDVQTLSFYDEPFVSLTILKRDSVTKAPLSGAEFSVKDAGGAVIANCATGADGTVTVSGLTPNASLVITETSAPAGYVLSETPQTVRVRSDAPNSVTFEDAPTGTLVIRKFIAGTANEPLSGVAFKVMYGNGKNIGTDDGVYYTDNAGEITLTGLTPGATVKAREIRTADGFVLDGTPQDIEIQPGQTQQLTFWNTRKGSLLVRKLDSVTGNPLSGVMFRITTATGEYVPNNDGHTSSNGFFTTDSAGEILLTNVTGTLVVTEFSTISGYVIEEATRSQTVVVNPDDTQTLVFYNAPMTSLTVQKYVTGTTTPLKGAKFLVSDSHGVGVGDSNGMFTTDENGRFVISDLIPGLTVTVKETEAPDGYVLDSTPQTVRIRSGISAQTLTFYNSPKGSISVRKLDAVTEQPLAGAEFKVTSANGVPLDNDGGKISTNGIYRTDDNGQFLITKVQPGAYVITETKAPEGYILDATPLTITVSADDAQTITVKNRPKQTLTVQKFVAGTSTPLSGVEFLVTDNRGAVIGPSNGIYTTDDNGRFVVSGLTPGQTITVKETKTVPGYILNDKPQSITIEDGDAQTLTFYNEAKSALLIVKRDSVTEQPLKGAEFQVLTADGKFVDDMGGALSSNGIYTTDERGQILISGLNPGVLVVKETKAPDGYMLDDKPQTVELKASETQTLTFRNVPKQTVIVQKYVEGTTNPLPGVTFLITDGGGNRIGAGEYVTDANGRIEIPGVNPGTTVIAREVKTASGYALNGSPKTLEVKVGTLNALTFYDEPLSTLIIRKYIEGTANEPLPGVAFKVVDGSGANVGTDDGVFYTDNAGEIRIENLEAGTVIKAREIKTVDGFVLDGTPQDILMQSGVEQELVFWNKRQGTLTISKLDSVTRQPLSGVEFKVAYADGRAIGDGRYFTDSRGEINITGINGTVTVTETATIPGYVMDADGRTQTVTVTPMEGRTVTFTNTPMQTLTVRKLIQGTTTPIPGAAFMVSDSSGAVLGNNNGEFMTDSHGEIVISGLIPGITVTAREVRPASGYVLNGEAQTIKIKSGDAQTLTFYNVPQESLTIRKYAEGTTSPLSGVTFYVTDGAGTPVGSGEFLTDDNGTVTIPGFAPGETVIVREVKTVKGYALNGTPKTLKIASGRENALTFYDAPLSTLLVHKYVDGTANEPLPGVTFKITDASGKNIGNADGIYVTDASGDITIPNLEAGTIIKAREIRTVDGYLLDGTPQDIEITKAAVNELTFWNVPAQTLIIEKRASDTDAPLQGVTFTVRDSGGAFVGENNGEFMTDRNGQIVIRGLVPGVTIIAQETKTISGYVLDETPQSILIQKGDAQKLVFRNAPKGALTVRKLDAATGQPLSGAEFHILTVSGTPVDDNEGQTSTNGVYTTDANGEIVIAKLQPGVYKVSESKAPDGYVLDTTAQTVTVNANDSQTLTFRDVPKQGLTIQKYAQGTTTPIVGAKFLITDSDGNFVGESNGEFTTDENGRIFLANLTPGVTITVKEISAADGYVLDGTPKSIKIKSGEMQTLTFYNVPTQRLVIQKYDAVSSAPLSGVTFHVTNASGKELGNSNGNFVTDANGQIVIDGLIPGESVIAKETKTISGYVLDSAPQTIKIQSGDAQTLAFFNAPKGALIVRKIDSLTDAPLSGAEFKVTTAKGEPVSSNEGATSSNGVYVTDDNGQFAISKLEPGAYVVTEIKAPDGYVLNSQPQTVTVEANDAQTLVFRNEPKQSLIIRKFVKGTDTPLKGVAFMVVDGSGKPVGNGTGEFVTDENGRIVISGLTPGMTVIAHEIRTVQGYALNGAPQNIQIVSGEAQTLTFYDEPLSTLVIRKFIEGTDNNPLSGVAFKVTDGNGKNVGPDDGVYYTDDAGEISIPNLEAGTTLKVREIKTVDGYVLDGTPQDIQILSAAVQTLTFWNAPRRSLTIQKYEKGTSTPIAGARFLVTDDGRPLGESNGEFTTDDNGRIVLANLTPGTTVTAQEIEAASGYVLDATPKSVKIKSEAAQTLTFYNVPTQRLIIQKYATDSATPIPGVTFHVTDTSGKTLGNANGEFVTDANGRIIIDGLPPGMSVTAQETKTVSGYILDATPQTIQIQSGEAQTLTFFNSPKGAIIVKKIDALTEQSLSGAEFKVTTLKGEPVDQNEGQTSTNGIYRTDDNGQFTIANVQPGVYIVTEIKAPDGYVLDNNPQTVTVNANDAQTLTFRDMPLQSVIIRKYIDGTTTPLSGVTFLITDANGSRIGNGEYVTDANGQIVLTGLTPGLTLVVREVKTVKGYVLNGAPQTIQVGNGSGASLLSTPSSVTATATGTGNSLTFYDEPLSTLAIHKYVSGTDNQPLPGVTFKVVDGSGKNIGNSDGIYVTDDSGDIVITDLEPGTVVKVREIKTVDGYILDGTPQDIQIQNSELHELTFWNAPKQSLTVEKYAKGTTTPLPGAKFLVTDNGQPMGESNGEFTTDDNGRFVLTELTPGVTITVKEIEAPDGYVLDGTPKTVKIKSGEAQSVTFYNVPEQRLIIQKYVTASTTPLSGVTFLITDTDGRTIGSSNGEFVTDANGRIVIEGLTPGMSVTAKETKAASGYILNSAPQTIKIQSGDAQSLVFYNSPKGSLSVIKRDSLTDAPLSGAEFKVTTAKGEVVDQNEGQTSTNGVYMTDADGQFTITGLQPGAYVVKETKAPEGYVLNTEPQTVTVNVNDAQTLTFRDIPLQSLTIQKYIDGTTKPLSGVTFLVTDNNGNRIGNGEYVTDANGQIILSGLTPGLSLVVREVRTVNGYVLNGAPQTIQIAAGGANAVTLSAQGAPNAGGNSLTFYDEPLSTLVVHKYVKGTDNEPLPGVTFKIVDGGGKNVGNSDGLFVTDANGDITIPGLEPGTVVKVREVKTVDGYVLDGTPQDIQIQNSELHELTFRNAPEQSLVIRKFAADTATPLSGVTFRVTDSEGKAIGVSNGEFVTDANGEILIAGLTPGMSVTAKETKTVSGYVLDSTPQTVKIKSGEAQSLTFYNSPKGSLSVIKRDSLTDAPLAGAEFKVTTAKGEVVDQNEGQTSTNGVYVTDANGQFTIAGLQPGAYVVMETKAPEGYVLDKTPQTVTVNANDAQTLTFRDAPKQTLTVEKYEKGTTTPIQGAKFLVTDNGEPVGENNGEFTTDDNGRFVLTGLVPGATITVKEIEAADGYVLDGTPKSIKIKSSAAQSLTFYNVPTQSLTVEKYAKGTTTPIPGAKFLVTDNGQPVGENNGEFTTDENGRFVVSGLIPGVTITVKEIEAAEGYVLDATPKTIKIKSGDAQTLTFQNVPTQNLLIRKYVTGTETPIPGVTFRVTGADGKAVGSSNGNFVTDVNGEVIVSGLVPGDILTVKETQAVSGYVLDSTPQIIKIQSGEAQSLTFFNTPKGSLSVRKLDAGTDAPLSGAEFKVTTLKGEPVDQDEGRISTNGVYVTDADGQFTITGLQPGAYVVTETKAPEGYVLDNNPQTVTVNANDAQTLTFRDIPLQSLTIQKYIDGTTNPLSGVTFLITDANGNRIGNGEYVTDAYGQIVLSGLTPGLTLVVREVRTVKGYVLNGAPQTIQISAAGANAVTLSAQGAPNAGGNSLTFYDEPLSTLVVHKYVSGTDNQPLSGVTFKVVDGSGRNVGNSDGVFVTDDSGDIVITDLEPGTVVKVREIKTVDGYVLDGTPQDIQIQNSELHELTFWNAPKQSLTVQKYAKGTTTPLSGAKFLVTDNGRPVGENGGEFTTDDNGRFVLTGLTPGVTITVKEIEAPDGYVLDGTPKTVKIKSGDAQSVTFYNVPEQRLIIQKYETASTTPISGVTFHVTDTDGTPLGNANGEFVTDANGQIVIDGLTPGVSIVAKETKAVSGYILDSAPQTIKIQSGEAQTLTFFNSPKGSLTVRKLDAGTDAPLSGAEFKVTTAKGEVVEQNEGRTSTNGVYVTDADGQFTITGLQPGAYVVAETKAPEGYVLDKNPQTVTVNANDAQTLTFRDVPLQSLVIRAYVSGTDNQPLPGVTFKVVDGNGANVGNSDGIFVTDDSGDIIITNLKPGTVIKVREIKTVDGYVLDGTPQDIQIQSGGLHELTFWNALKQSLAIRIFVTDTTTPIPGATFHASYANGEALGDFISDNNGEILISGLNPGVTVTVKEIRTVSGYILDSMPQTVKIKSGEAQSLVFYNSPKGSLTVTKRDSLTDAPLAGAEFKVTTAKGEVVDQNEGQTSTNGVYKTDANGQFRISGLQPGAYVVVETKAPDGYMLDSEPQTVTVNANDAQTLTFRDVPKQALTVEKYAKGTTTPIPSAKFLVTNDGQPVGDSNGEFVTDDNGRFVLTGLIPGDTITVKEIEAAEGYALEGTPKSVKIKSGDAQSLTFYNVPLQSLTIQKYIDGTTKPLSGVTFLVTDNNGNRIGNGEYVTDDNGQIVLTGLTPSMSLVVREVKTVKGYVLNGAPQTIQIGATGANAVTLSAQPSRGASAGNSTTGGNSLTFYDEPLSTLVVHNYVKGTDNEPLPGVTFKIVDGSGKNVGNSDGLFVTDDNGDITIPDLEPGTVVKVREVKAVDGYVLDGTPQDIEIQNSELHELTFWNSPKQSLVIRIFVTDTTTPIPGATFHVAYSDGKAIGDFVTDNNGEILISGLVPGVTVTAKETKSVSGYILDATPQSVKIKSNETQTITFYNSPKGSLSVVKLDSLTERPLSGAEFRVTTAKGEFVDANEGQTSTNGVYRTDESGRFTISSIAPGSYVVTEIKAPDGYVLDSEPQTVTVNANDAQTLTFRDAPVQTLIVEVFVTDTTTPIPGTAFIVTAQDGKPIGDANGEFIADENGRITIPGLTPGMSVTVTETKAANGYLPDGTPKTILIKSGNAQNLRFYNSPAQTLTVQMFVTGTTDPIPGVTFHITDSNGKVIGNENGDFVTEKDGQIVIPGLIPGTSVTVKETKTVSGYVLDTTPQTIAIRSGDAQTLTFYNAPKGALVLRAVDAVTEETLPDVEFKIVSANGEPLDSNEGKTSSNGIYKTDDNGTVTLTKVQPGLYSIVTTKVPDGYVLNEEPQTVTVNADDTQTLVFRIVPKQSLTIQVYEEGTTKPIQGITFLLKDSGGAFIGPDNGEYTTDANGQITVSGLTPGVTVVANEIRTVTGYVLNNVPQNIKIQTGDAQKLTFFNIPLESLTIWKFQKGTTNPLQGVAFLVVDGDGEPINGGEYVTDENGRIVIDGLEPGITVTAREIRTVKGYQLNGNPQNIKIASGKDNALTFYDDPLSTLIVRLYVDSTENEPISGAAFKVVDGSGKSIGSDDGVYYTDHAGMFTLENLEPGVTVKARLIKIADEFVLDGTPQDILVESGNVQSLTFWAQRAGSLTIRSLDSVTRQPIPNVEFKVTYADGRPVDTANGQVSSAGRYFTDANGEIRITGVIATIIVTEEKAADNYTMDSANRSQTVVVLPADGQTLTFFDAPAQGLTVQLYVKGTTTPISGAKFLLTDGTGAKLGDENGEFTTDGNGRFSLSGLKPGLTVKVKQISTTDAYILDGTPKTVTIKTDSEQTVTVYNVPKQTLTVRLYVKGTETPISGAKFLLRDSGGALLGENNGVFTTNDNGEFTITGLTPGVTITATQTETISGYVLDETPQNILIKSGNAQSLVFYNAPKGALFVRKLDAATEKPLAGAEFKILTINGTPVDDNEGKTSTKGIYRTDDNGEITLLKLEPGVYTVTETKAPSGYALDSQPQTVTVNANDRQTLTFRDNPLQSLTITKYEDGTTKPLSGVTFLITDANGNRVGNGEYTTDRNGQITITGLAPGTTVIAREVRTVKGYVLNGNPQTITIGNGANALTSGASAGNGTATGNALTFYDEPLSTLVIHKYIEGTDNAPLANVEFKITDGRGAKVGNGTYYTDKSGEIRVENLEPGMTVTVRETKTVSGYVLDGTPKTAEIPSGDVLEMDFWNSRQGALVVRKQDAETKAPLGGVEFKITYADGRPVDADNGQISSAGQYFTDDNGEIRISGITGTLIVTEEKAAPGYVIDQNAKTKTVTVNPGDTQTLTFFNQKKQTLTVQKFVEGTKTPIPGVTFLITDSAGTVIGADNGEFVTDDNGRIVISDLTPGVTITAKETKAADGYALNDTPKSIEIKSGAAQTLTFYNALLRSLVITKYVKGTTKPISGAVFQITDADGVPLGNGEYVTDDNGQIVIPNLAPGVTVSVREVRSASGFVLNGTPQTLKIKATGNNALTFYDEPLSTLVIHKYEEGTQNKPLSGVEFRITDGSGASVGNGTFYTDKNGEIRVENLEPGMTVTVCETKTVSGYILDSTPKTAEIPSGNALEMVFWNSAKQTLKIQKFVEGTTTPIKGVTFLVTDQTGAPVGDANGEFVTDENGEIVIDGLTPGDVITARETKAASGYVLDSQPKSVTIKSGAAQTLRFYNSPQGSLIIEKRDKLTQKPLSGATFQIMTAGGGFADNAGGRLSSNGQYTTDANGQIILTGLNPDTLTVKEIAAPSGYELDAAPQTVKVNANDTQTLTFYDTPQQTLTVLKLAEDTNAPLQGVTFLVTSGDGSVVGPNNGLYTTDANGLISIPGLTPGVNVTVRESRTVSGYQLDTAPQSIQIKSGEAQRLTFYNKPVEPLGGLLIKKMDAATKEPLSGVAFKVTRADGSVVGVTNGEFVTDGSGLISIRDLEPGTYVVREIRAKDGYLLDDTAKTIEIKDRQTYTLEFYNAAKGGLILHKLDSVTKEPIAGVQFKIAYADGTYVNRGNLSSNGLYLTDKEGQIVISGIAGTVVITEMRTVDGYKIDPATRTQTVEIKANETQSVTVYNEPVGGVEIIKVNEDDRTIRIPNVTFEIRKTEGGLVKTVTTGQNGRVYVPLDAGAYYALEIETAKGYRLDATPQYFDVEDGKTTTLTVRNKAFSGILIHKTDSVTGKGIYGVSFLLYDANKNPIRQYESDQNGYVYMDNLPNSGRYYVREMENPGYVLDTQLKTVYVEAGNTIEIEWKNQPVTGQIQVYKYAAEDNAVTGTAAGAPLQGAVYEIVNVRSGQVVGQIVTDARGVAASEPLPLARYQVKEVTAPAYWQIDATVHDVTLEYAGQIIKVSAFDKPAKLGVTLTKSGLKEVLAGDRMIYRFTVANTSNVALKNFFWHDKLPYDVTSGYAITTGVYSARLNYRVLYKTNYNEYRVLASNLLSTNNYALPLSALPLESGEVVTDIRFDFGTVPSGFYSTTQPTLTVSVSPKATDGYRIVNRADAGGQYGETWETANAGWTTIVRRLSPPKPLPKTGY